MKTAIVFLFLITLSSVSFAQYTFLKLGTYEKDGTLIEVTKTNRDGLYEVRAQSRTNGYGFVNFFINTFTWELSKTRLGIFKPLERYEYEDSMLMSWKYGGTFNRREDEITLSVSTEDGSILGIESSSKIPIWGLPNGLHSGPLKKLFESLKCGDHLEKIADFRTF